MANANLTVANAVYTITIPGVFGFPQALQGYAADDVFSTEAVTSIETVMGLDGQLSAGWFFTEKKQTIVLQANSPSINIFDEWNAQQEAAQDAFIAEAQVLLRGIQRLYVCSTGYLTSYTPMPDARKILQPRRFTITWGKIVVAPI